VSLKKMSMKPKRLWYVLVDTNGYTIVLEVFGETFTDYFSTDRWQEHPYKKDLLKCSIRRLQKKAVDATMPLVVGRFECDDWIGE